MKILIAYGTRFGATEKSANLLSEELIEKYHNETIVLPADKATKDDVEWAELVVIGTSIVLGHWKKSSKKILTIAKNKSKPIAIFASAAVTLSDEVSTEKLSNNSAIITDRVLFAVKKFIDPVCTKYGVTPISKTAFGGILTIMGSVVLDNLSVEPIQNWAEEISKASALPV